MIYKPFHKLKPILTLLLIITTCLACSKKANLSFNEISITDTGETTIEINIPQAKGSKNIATPINTTLAHFVNNALDIDATNQNIADIKKSIDAFKNAYKTFKTQIGKTLYTSLPPWEVIIDGELLYQNQTFASIVMNSSINTGGAHNNLVVKFFNFNVANGEILQIDTLIKDIPGFTVLAKKYFDKELLSASDERMEAFKSDTFALPNQIGFSEDGVILFYQTFNTATNNIIEFTIPYTVANNYLNF